jgi:hypothetical protein
MLKMAIQYRAIDDLTADKSMKLRQFELDDNDWVIIEDLLSVLKVRSIYFYDQSLFMMPL